MSAKTPLPNALKLVQTIGIPVGIVGLAAGIIAAFATGGGWDLFFQATLYSFWLLLSFPLGAMALLMIHHMTAGGWSFISQRVLEAFTRSIWIPFGMFLLFWIGTLTGLHTMFDRWIYPVSHLVEKKVLYLNLPFWSARSFFYFAVWGATIFFFNKWSKELQNNGDALITLKFRRFAPVCLIAYCLTMTFAAVDWGQSLEPEWFSTMYAPLFWISQGLTTFAATTLILFALKDTKPISRYITVEHFHTFGNLMLGFIVIWTYMSFSQYLIIWAGNLPTEIAYYLERSDSQFYNILVVLLLFGHFFIPFMYLLQRRFTYNVGTLCVACWWILAFRTVDIFFIINPAFHHGDNTVPGRDLLVYPLILVGYAGIFFWYFSGQLAKGSPLPVNDPRMHEALDPGHGHADGEEAVQHG